MNQQFHGWEAVADKLRQRAEVLEEEARRGNELVRLNAGQRDSLRAIAARLPVNGVLIADEVGMGKTRIAVEVARAVRDCGGRVAILVPPGLGYQWEAELREGGIQQVQPILRSVYSFLAAWEPAEDGLRPWFSLPIVLASHAFTNWRFGTNSHTWRWALLPELYARWREATESRLPRHYHEYKDEWLAASAAKSIVAAVPSAARHPVRRVLDELCATVPWSTSRLYDGSAYGRWSDLRPWLEKCVGAGLGVFDLLIIDEAHKSRGGESGLSRLLDRVILSSDAARRLALTATPVELNVKQWDSTLRRLALSEEVLTRVSETSHAYAEAVERVRQTWRTSGEAREGYKRAAAEFQGVLSPYLIRRDKREDPHVQSFHAATHLPVNAYRREREVLVETADLPDDWKVAICAAESLSVVTRHADDPVAKRLRLTLGNGHGIATFLDSVKRAEEDATQEDWEAHEQEDAPTAGSTRVRATTTTDNKREARAQWWLDVLRPVFDRGEEALFDHPAIGAAVRTIEESTSRDEKVLVFGRFVRPLRTLVDLLNARAMLRRIQDKAPWPHAKVHDAPGSSEWPAVRAAHRQLDSPVSLDTLDRELRQRYEREGYRRERFRERLLPGIEEGLVTVATGPRHKQLFDAFRRSVAVNAGTRGTEPHALAPWLGANGASGGQSGPLPI